MGNGFFEIHSQGRVFLKLIKPPVSKSSPQSMGEQYLFKTSFPCGSSNCLLENEFQHFWIPWLLLQTGAIRIKKRTHFCFTFRSTLQVTMKWGNAHRRLMFLFWVIASVPWLYGSECHLCIEGFDDISVKQINLLLENLVVKKLFEKFWDEEDTLTRLGSSLVSCLLLYLMLKAGTLLWLPYFNLEDNVKFLCLICLVCFLFLPF